MSQDRSPDEGAADAYGALVDRIRATVEATTRPGGTVAVVSRGDADIVRFAGRAGAHFPQTPDGLYAGHHPADSEDAIRQLEALIANGADYLVFPETANWWLEHYDDFRNHLERWYRRVVDEKDTCVVFSLREPAADKPYLADQRASLRYRELVQQVREVTGYALPSQANVLVISQGDDELLDLDGRRSRPFPAAENSALIEELEAARSDGAEFLVVPTNAFWWLDWKSDFKRYLEATYRLVVRQQHVCRVYELAK